MLKINKVNDNVIFVEKTNDEGHVILSGNTGAVYYAFVSNTRVSLLNKANNAAFVSGDLKNTYIDGELVPQSPEEASKLLNGFVGLGFKQGGPSSSPTPDDFVTKEAFEIYKVSADANISKLTQTTYKSRMTVTLDTDKKTFILGSSEISMSLSGVFTEVNFGAIVKPNANIAELKDKKNFKWQLYNIYTQKPIVVQDLYINPISIFDIHFVPGTNRANVFLKPTKEDSKVGFGQIIRPSNNSTTYANTGETLAQIINGDITAQQISQIIPGGVIGTNNEDGVKIRNKVGAIIVPDSEGNAIQENGWFFTNQGDASWIYPTGTTIYYRHFYEFTIQANSPEDVVKLKRFQYEWNAYKDTGIDQVQYLSALWYSTDNGVSFNRLTSDISLGLSPLLAESGFQPKSKIVDPIFTEIAAYKITVRLCFGGNKLSSGLMHFLRNIILTIE